MKILMAIGLWYFSRGIQIIRLIDLPLLQYSERFTLRFLTIFFCYDSDLILEADKLIRETERERERNFINNLIDEQSR